MPERVVNDAQLGIRGVLRCSSAPQVRGGFTLIDVLVTMAVIAVLISLLSPSLTLIRESARQVVCRSNLRQIGIGISMYAEVNKDRIPGSENAPPVPNGGQPWDTMDLRFAATSTTLVQWDGLGHLFKEEFLPAPKLFYCFSHHGNHSYVEYASDWGGGSGSIVGNFQYRAAGLSQRPTAPNQSPELTSFLSRMMAYSALVADGMRTQDDFNHRVGANVLRAGLSVDWWPDRTGTFVGALPKDGQVPTGTQFLEAWRHLDDPLR